MSAFAGWNFIGCTAGILKDQGVNILLNIFWGPVVNAARGIAFSVNSAVSGFAGNFMAAINPQITKSYATKDYQYMFFLIEKGSCFSFYILWILSLPILFETDFILKLWLKNYPEYSVEFVRLVLLLSLCDIISNSLITSLSSTGKIRNYQIVVGSILLLNFPFSYICLNLGFSPDSTLVISIIMSLLCLVVRLIFLKKMIGLSVSFFFKNVCVKILYVSFCSMMMPLLLTIIIPHSLWKSFLVICVSIMSALFIVYFGGCSRKEKQFIRDMLFKKYL